MSDDPMTADEKESLFAVVDGATIVLLMLSSDFLPFWLALFVVYVLLAVAKWKFPTLTPTQKVVGLLLALGIMLDDVLADPQPWVILAVIAGAGLGMLFLFKHRFFPKRTS